jgi:hypothetical protein
MRLLRPLQMFATTLAVVLTTAAGGARTSATPRVTPARAAKALLAEGGTTNWMAVAYDRDSKPYTYATGTLGLEEMKASFRAGEVQWFVLKVGEVTSTARGETRTDRLVLVMYTGKDVPDPQKRLLAEKRAEIVKTVPGTPLIVELNLAEAPPAILTPRALALTLLDRYRTRPVRFEFGGREVIEVEER